MATSSLSRLCQTCRSLSPQALMDERPIVLPSGIETTASGYHHVSDYSVVADSRERCPLCAMLFDNINGKKLKPGKKHGVILKADRHQSDPDAPYEIAGIVALVENSDYRAYFHVFADEDNAAATSGDIAGRRIPLLPDLQTSYAKVKSWVETCTNFHHECQPPANAVTMPHKFPTRLIQVTHPSNDPLLCLLVETNKPPGHDPQTSILTDSYAALSYCWGLTPQLRTLQSNLAAHCSVGIPLSTLPLTIREAIIFSRRVGIPYLWVDALCIVQDSVADWSREAPQMGHIYAHARLVIAAAGSSDSSGGLFHSPREADQSSVGVEYKRKSPSCQQAVMYIAPARNTFLTEVEQSVWNTRGWILQERNLARRLIILGRGQTFFECIRHTVGEDGKDLSTVQTKRFGGGRIPQGEMWGWCLLVMEFTKRNLTVKGDRLVAVHGLATAMMERVAREGAIQYSAELCFGLEVEKSAVHVLWYCVDGVVDLSDENWDERRAPSWSWARIDGPVAWEPGMIDAVQECVLELDGEQVIPSPVDEMARKARIRFEGMVVNVERDDARLAEQESSLVSDVEGYMGYVIDVRTHPACYAMVYQGRRIGWAAFDEASRINGPFVAACISRNDGNDRGKEVSINVLVLKQGCDGVYMRAGMGEIIHLAGVGFREVVLEIA